jgi:hypothetical protein
MINATLNDARGAFFAEVADATTYRRHAVKYFVGAFAPVKLKDFNCTNATELKNFNRVTRKNFVCAQCALNSHTMS